MRKLVEPKVSVEHAKYILELTQNRGFSEVSSWLSSSQYQSKKVWIFWNVAKKEIRKHVCAYYMLKCRLYSKNTKKSGHRQPRRIGLISLFIHLMNKLSLKPRCAVEGQNKFHNIACLRKFSNCGVNIILASLILNQSKADFPLIWRYSQVRF